MVSKNISKRSYKNFRVTFSKIKNYMKKKLVF